MIIRTFTTGALLTALSQMGMAQAPALTSTISGVVWQDDKPANGVRVSSEKKIAGILVKLLDAQTQEIVSTALSDVNGQFSLKANAGTYQIEYIYPSDGFTTAPQRVGSDETINSAADADNFTAEFTVGNNQAIANYGLGLVSKENTLTYCTQKEAVVTEWSEVLSLPKSSVTAVPLNVKIFAAESVFHPVIGIENTGTANGYTITAAGKVTMNPPVGASIVMNSDVTLTGSLSNFDGVRDYDGTSGDSFYNKSSFVSMNPGRNISNSSQIAANFVGAENSTFGIPTLAQSSVAVIGSGNLETFVQTYVSAGACVVYTYPSGALPVTLAGFSAVKNEKTAQLNWTTASESNSDRFEIQRSANGKSWENIGVVRSVVSSSAMTKYMFTDEKPLNGSNLYRLKMIDLDETFSVSKIVSLDFKGASSLVVYPNPVSDKLFIKTSPENAVAAIQVFDQNGKNRAQSAQGNDFVNVQKLETGIYSVRIVYNTGSEESHKVLITR